MISDIPWNGPIGCVRLGQIDGEFVVNPTNEQMYDSTLDLIYVGSEKEMMMIEADPLIKSLKIVLRKPSSLPMKQSRTSSKPKRNWLNFAEKPKGI